MLGSGAWRLCCCLSLDESSTLRLIELSSAAATRQHRVRRHVAAPAAWQYRPSGVAEGLSQMGELQLVTSPCPPHMGASEHKRDASNCAPMTAAVFLTPDGYVHLGRACPTCPLSSASILVASLIDLTSFRTYPHSLHLLVSTSCQWGV